MSASVHSQENTVAHYVVIPPDGGWGWVIVAACFTLNFIIDGVTYTFGIFLDDIGKSFSVHPTKAAVASSLMSGFYYMVGPLTCALTNRFGFRIVGISGCALSAAVFLVASYLNNFEVFLIVTGCLGGTGFNMIYTNCLLIVSFYFERWRALTTAISVTGTSIGIMAFPPVINNVLERFDWRTKFRILSGICAGLSLLVLTFKSIEPIRVYEKGPTTKSRLDSIEETIFPEKFSTEEEGSIGSFNVEEEEPTGFWNNVKWIFSNLHNIFYPTVIQDNVSGPQSTFVVVFPESEVVSRRAVSFNPSTNISIEFEMPEYLDENPTPSQGCCKNCPWQRKNQKSYKTPSRPMYRDDILFPGSIYTLPQFERARVATASIITPIRADSVSYHLRVTRTASPPDLTAGLKERRISCQALVRVLVTMLNVRLLKSPSFMLLVISGFITMIGLYSPFVFLTQRGQEIGLEPTWCTLLLTMIGVSNTVGRIICGTLSCCPALDLTVVSYITLILAGGVTMASCFMDNLRGQLIFTITFGFCMASFTVLRSVILSNLVGLENLTNAFGINILFYGLGSFIGVPLAGIIQNKTGKYAYSFFFAGTAFLLSGIILIPIGKVAKWEKRKKKRVGFDL